MHDRYRVQIIADSSAKWIANGIQFVTISEAIVYAKDLASRWIMVEKWRVVSDDDHVSQEDSARVYPMDDHKAVALAEGFEEAQTEEEVLLAWQHLHDTGLGYSLQGFFGRNLHDMIEAGLIDA